MMNRSFKFKPPIFHDNGEISYFSPRYCRWYRVHPLRVPYSIVILFSRTEFEKWKVLAPEHAIRWFK